MEILKSVFGECGLEYEAVPYEYGIKGLQAADEKSTIVYCAADSFQSKEKYCLDLTESFFTASYNLVGKRGVNIDLGGKLRVAFTDSGRGEKELVEKQYPGWRFIVCGSAEECLSEVKSGRADLALLNALVQETRSAAGADEELLTVRADAVSTDICIGMVQEQDRLLKDILNKGIKKLDDREVEQCVFNYILSVRPRITPSYLLDMYPKQVLAGAAAVSLAAVILAVLFSHNRMQKRQNRILQEKNRELQEAIEAQRRLQLESEQDPLTGLKNKKAAERLCRELLQGMSPAQYALLVLDVDDFKRVNDTRGHIAGDEVLKGIAGCMQSVFAAQCIGRIGGDEFMIMAALEDGRSGLESLLEKFYKEVAQAGLPGVITCSIGAVFAGEPAADFKELFQRADAALYEAKSSGKNKCVIR